MKANIFPVLLALLALASFSFAQPSDTRTQCEEQCCSSYQGTWDSSGNQCTGYSSGTSYNACVSSCVQTAGTIRGCCGGAFILAIVPAAVLLQRHDK